MDCYFSDCCSRRSAEDEAHGVLWLRAHILTSGIWAPESLRSWETRAGLLRSAEGGDEVLEGGWIGVSDGDGLKVRGVELGDVEACALGGGRRGDAAALLEEDGSVVRADAGEERGDGTGGEQGGGG